MDKKKRALFSYDAGDWYLSPLNNIYESFMYIYGHLRDAVGKGAGASFLFLT